jgi:ATP-binding cassette subfamily F protein 3
MIIFDNVRKQYGPQEILRDASFSVKPGERIGVVGPNGAGKSTIFRLILKEEDFEAGDVIVPSDLRIGHLRQQLPERGLDTSLLQFVREGHPELLAIEQELHDLHEQVGSDSDPALLHRIGDLQHDFEHRDGYQFTARAEAALSGLGFATSRFQSPLGDFSGGWQMRAQLARVLLAMPDILLLDEPSNYLDLPAVEWLQRFLAAFPGTLMLISHDRHLLRSLARDIFDVRHAKVTRYSGGFDAYQKERVARMEQQEARWKTLHKQREEMETFIRRFRAQATKASLVQSRIKMLEKMEPLPELDPNDPAAFLRLPPPPHSGHEMMRLEGVGHRYGEDAWLFRNLDLRVEKGERVALVGYNGMGKTTLLKILAGVMSPSEGRRVPGHQVVVGYQSQDFAETLPSGTSVFRILRDAAPGGRSDTEIRTMLGSFGFRGEACDKPAGVLSGGEKIRLAFARIFINPPNLLLLDEPTTHLDIAGCEALEKALQVYQGTVCLVSHDVSFVRNTATGIISIGAEGVRRWVGGYDDYLERSGGGAAGSAPKASTRGAPAPDGKQRREMQKLLRKLESNVEKLEAEIGRLEKEQTAGVTALQTGNVSDFASHQKRLNEVAGLIHRATREWIEAGEALEKVQTELGG